jgi:hydroxylamine reductase
MLLSRALKQALSRTALPAGRRAVAFNFGGISALPSRLSVGRNMSMVAADKTISNPAAFNFGGISAHSSRLPVGRNMSMAAADNTISNPAMFCRQCEQTQDHFACRSVGICGKSPETSAMQDVLMHSVKSIALWAVAARQAGASADEMKDANSWTLSSVFATLTNVNFDESRIEEYIREGMAIKRDLEEMVRAKGGVAPDGDVARLDLSKMDTNELEDFGHLISIPELQKAMGNDDCFSLVEVGTYGSKGVCAYAAHCRQLGYMDEDVMAGIHEVFAKLASSEPDMNGLLANALRVGELNGKVLAMLDEAHAATFGAPEPTQVKVTATEGKCILVSGHDLLDLEILLKQTEGTGVNVYTHGEMLPAHGYPGLKKYPHLVGNYGTGASLLDNSPRISSCLLTHSLFSYCSYNC